MSIPDAREPLGGRDTEAECHGQIYGEASCRPDDVLYQGSEDEDYDDPQIRQQKCEDAAQRYLNGHVPLLLSASLRGPFHKESGWQNPWRSKVRTSGIRQSLSTSLDLPLDLNNKCNHLSPSLQAAESMEIPEALSCHLPSPESLKQAPYTESHPYLIKGTLAVVQEWRNSMSPASSSDNITMASQPAEPAGKRKRANSKGLKSTATKRKKSEINGHGSSDTSMLKDRMIAAAPHKYNVISVSSLLNGSFDSLPHEFAKSDTEPSEARKYVGDIDYEDELSVSPATSLHNKSTLPCKKLFSRTKLSQSPAYPSQHSDDELGPIEKAGASLSSPLSHKGNFQSFLPATETNDTKPANQSFGNMKMDQSSSPLSYTETSELDLREMGTVDADTKPSRGDELDFETQKDNSFAYKVIRPNRTRPIKSLSTSQTLDKHHHDSNASGNTDSAMGNSHEEGQVKNELEVEQPRIEEQSPRHATTVFHHNKNLLNGQDQNNTSYQHAFVESQASAIARSEVDTAGPSNAMMIENTTGKMDMKSDNQSFLVQRPMVRNRKAESPTNVSGSASPSDYSQDTSNFGPGETLKSEAALIHRPALAQEKPFSIKSLLNYYVSPLRKLPGLSGHSGIHEQQNVDSELVIVDTARSSNQKTTEREVGMELQQHKLQTMENTETKMACQTRPSANHGFGSIQPHVSNDKKDSALPLAVSRGLTADYSGANQSQTPEASHRIPSLSQQSPCIPAPSSQSAAMTSTGALSDETKDNGEHARWKGNLEPSVNPVEAQSPWARDTLTPTVLREGISGALERRDATFSPSETQFRQMKSSPRMNNESKNQTPIQVKAARPSTPEPQFSTPSFASFMTPSPERHSRQRNQRNYKDASYQSILASAMRNPWRSVTSDRRVSWAPLPHETESPCGIRHSSKSAGFALSATSGEVRPASPPPRTPMSAIPVSEDAKFRGHFAAMANRSGAFGRTLLASSHHEGCSPEPEAAEEKSLGEDDIDTTETSRGKPAEKEKTPVEPSHRNADDSQDPMNIVDDIFNELGDFLQTWDIDAELEAAKKVRS